MFLLEELNIYIKPASLSCKLNQGRAGMETVSNDQHMCLTRRETVSLAGSGFKVLALHFSE